MIFVLCTYFVSAVWPQAHKKGRFIKFDIPGMGTGPYQGIVNLGIVAGIIAGHYMDASAVNHGFLRTYDGTITNSTFQARAQYLAEALWKALCSGA